jgi:hypothetical protein
MTDHGALSVMLSKDYQSLDPVNSRLRTPWQSTDRITSTHILASIQVRYEMGPLPLGRGEMAGGNQSPPEQGLLILTIQDDDLHDQVLIIAKQGADLRIALAFGGCHGQPTGAVVSQFGQGVFQAGQSLLPGLADFENARGIGQAQGLALPFDHGKNLLADRAMLAQVV